MNDEAPGRRELEATGAAILAGVERRLPWWVQEQVSRIVDSWDGLDPGARAVAESQAIEAGRAASERVTAALRALLATDPDEQASTPLQVVRSAYREPTEVLEAAGVPPVVRDEFDERTWPDDRYGLVPRSLGDLGDPELAPLHVAWGLAKAKVIRARRAPT